MSAKLLPYYGNHLQKNNFFLLKVEFIWAARLEMLDCENTGEGIFSLATQVIYPETMN